MNINSNLLKALLLSTATTLAACGGNTVDKIVDKIDTPHSASISYINAQDYSSTFYVKSTVYNESVFSDKFEMVELINLKASTSFAHKWINSAQATLFGTEDSITKENQITTNLDLVDNEQYWAVSWDNNTTAQLSILQKKRSNAANTYNVRVFTTISLALSIVGSQETITVPPNTVTGFYNLDNCSDLYVGDNLIDLCQIGNIGMSYLAIVDANGQLILVEE